MNKLVILCMVSMLLLPLMVVGCAEKQAATTTTTSPKVQTVEITQGDFSAEKNRLEYVEMEHPGTLTVKLGSNPSTGYSWGDAEIVHPEVIKQISRNYEKPAGTGLLGAPGTEVWVFNTTDTGLAMIKFSYGQPWAGGEKDAFTVTININVR